MNCSKRVLWFFLWLVPLQCTTDDKPLQLIENSDKLAAFPIAIKVPKKKKRTGKLKNVTPLFNTYTKTNLSTFSLPRIDEDLTNALLQQLKLLKRRKQDFAQQFGNVSLNLTDLETTIELLLLWQQTYPQGLEEHLNAYQLKGQDGKGNVKFTGYFTPELKVSKRPSKHYPYPIYAYPEDWKGHLPTRQQIDGEGVLKGRNLELAYTKHLADIYYMQLQGSGLVRYRNGQSKYFGFAGSNRHPYSSIGKYIKNNESIRLKNISMDGVKTYLKYHPAKVEEILFTNPSYVFFEAANSKPLGAGHVPLTADYSIAVDPKHVPLGSCLLAALPVIDAEGDFSHHEYKFMLAQDVGGAIRGNGHVDVYCGVGTEGQQKAMALHHYGQLWLLLPKPTDEIDLLLSTGALVRDNMELIVN
ncbi:MAG: murein transglycosylase A [Saprospiraceae bacterium]